VLTSPESRRRTNSARRQFLAVITAAFIIFQPALFAPASVAGQKKERALISRRGVADTGGPNNSTAQSLPFSQNWTNTGIITANDDWSGVPGIEGFFLNSTNSSTGIDPQTVTTDTFNGGTTTVDLDVIANQTNPNTLATGGVAEFEQTQQAAPANTNPVIALNGSGTADAPFILLNLNTTGQTGINVSYNLRDLDCSIDNATQAVALMFRVGNTGSYTNVAAGFVADATARSNSTATDTANCTLVTPVSVTLPASADNQSLVQVRIITTNAVGNDEWVGIDDINVTTNVVPPQPTLSINDVTQAEGDAGTSTFTFTVSLTAAAAGNVTFDIATADGTAQDDTPATEDNDYVAKSETGRTITAGNTSATFTVSVNGDTTTEPNETFFVNVTNVTGATAGDAQGLGTITNDDVTLTPIHTIQGSGTASPLATQSVTTRGIVTGIKSGSSGGFFIQEPDATVDADPNTSEGVFVFTGATIPAAAVVGNNVQVTGTVQEFVFSSDPNSPPITEISGTVTASTLSTGNPLPAPITLTAPETTAPSETTNPLDTLEEYEGMRVNVVSMTVVAPTDGSINEPNATVSGNDVFYGVVTGVTRPFREPGVNISDTLPAGAPANVPRFDENPERIRVDSDGQPGTTPVDVAAGTLLSNVTGPLDYSFRTYTILPDATIVPGTQPGAVPAPTPTANELTVASFNMERFFDTVNDPGGDPVLTQAAFDKRLDKASRIIRTVQRYPDVIGVEEMEHLSTLQAVAAKINADAQSIDGLPNPNYVAYLVEGNDIGGIDNGLLVKESRVTTIDVTQIEQAGCDHVTPSTCNNYVNPNDGALDILNDRPPLVLRATAPRPAGGTFAFTVIVNHLRSLSGVDDNTVDGSGTVGARVREKRRKQAEFLANLIQARQVADPTEKIINVGDMNAFQFNDGYVDVIGTVKGTPSPNDTTVVPGDGADLVNPNLTDLVDTLTPDQRYSFTFDGNAQVLDHILVNDDALAVTNRFVYARDDADYPVKNYELANELRLSDHDQPIVYLSLAAPQAAGTLIISEFRFRGPNGSQDEFVELYNNTDSGITVSTTDASDGWALVASDGVTRFFLPNGSLIPARAHFLAVGSSYSLSAYANGDEVELPTLGTAISFPTDIPDGAGIALFRTSNPVNFTTDNRLDAAGYAGVDALYREGTGFPAGGAETTSNLEYSFFRDFRNNGTGNPKDAGDNATDFLGADTAATSGLGLGQRLGAPGPENLSSPIQRNDVFAGLLLDGTTSSSSPPNRFRNAGDTGANKMFGSMELRRRIVNNTGETVTRLRFRIIDTTTFPATAGRADLRALTSTDLVVSSINDAGTCGAVQSPPSTSATPPCSVTVRALTLEAPPSQPNGGGFNSSLSADSVTITPLAPGESINIRILLGVQATGNFRFFINIEAESVPNVVGAGPVKWDNVKRKK
jgi:predicted extracellular nuclease